MIEGSESAATDRDARGSGKEKKSAVFFKNKMTMRRRAIRKKLANVFYQEPM